jgi:hypothetical protein
VTDSPLIELLEDLHIFYLRIASRELHERHTPTVRKEDRDATMLIQSRKRDHLKELVQGQHHEPRDAQQNGR